LDSDLHRDVTLIAKVMFPEKFFQKTFINYLIVFNGKTSGISERVHAFLKNYAKFLVFRAEHRGDADIYDYRAKRCLTNMRNHKMANLDCFMIRVAFVLYHGLFREGMLAIIDGMKNDRQHEQEIRLVDKRTSRRIMNDASVIRATILKHRSVLGHVNPRENSRI
jgi:hypothetical protein